MLTDQDRDQMRREDHGRLIRVETCLQGLKKTQDDHGKAIKTLYDRMTPITEWIVVANSWLKIATWGGGALGVIVLIVSLIWHGGGVLITMLARSVSQPQTQRIVLDPDAPVPEEQVRRPEGGG